MYDVWFSLHVFSRQYLFSIEELQCLQAFHLWRITSVDPSSIELLYDSKYKVTMPCRRFTPLPGDLQISPIVYPEEEDFPLLGQLMVIFAKRHAIQSETKATLRSVTNFNRNHKQQLILSIIDNTKNVRFLGFIFPITMAIEVYRY